jgi:hypothetical protein
MVTGMVSVISCQQGPRSESIPGNTQNGVMGSPAIEIA